MALSYMCQQIFVIFCDITKCGFVPSYSSGPNLDLLFVIAFICRAQFWNYRYCIIEIELSKLNYRNSGVSGGPALSIFLYLFVYK